MLRGLIVIAIALLGKMSRTACFELKITNTLENAEKLKKEDWISVEIAETGPSENVTLTVKIAIPLSLQYSDASVFFANESKEILQVYLKETVRGKFFEMPYRIRKEVNGEKVTVNTEGFHQISGSFPKSWLPEKCGKVSASVTSPDGKIYNYYGLRNFAIGIQDLSEVTFYTFTGNGIAGGGGVRWTCFFILSQTQ